MTTYTVDVPAALLDHTEHLPETLECACGYVRAPRTVVAGFVCVCGAKGELYEGATADDWAAWDADNSIHDDCRPDGSGL